MTYRVEVFTDPGEESLGWLARGAVHLVTEGEAGEFVALTEVRTAIGRVIEQYGPAVSFMVEGVSEFFSGCAFFEDGAWVYELD